MDAAEKKEIARLEQSVKKDSTVPTKAEKRAKRKRKKSEKVRLDRCDVSIMFHVYHNHSAG